MLEILTVENFQAHEKLILEFDPRVTTVLGPSDSGKTALIRLLKWIAFNRPSGDAFIRHGAKHARGILRIDGKEIKRIRGDGKNFYKFEGKVYKALGAAGVPPEVAKLLNLSDVNFQGQLDPPFWFADTPGQVSRQLNAVINLGVIDDSLAAVASELRTAKVEASVAEKRLTEARDLKRGLDWVVEFDTELKSIESIRSVYIEKASKRANLTRSLKDVTQARLERDRSLEASVGAQGVVQSAEALLSVSKRRKRLQKLLRELSELSELANTTVPSFKKLDALKRDLEIARVRRWKLTEGLKLARILKSEADRLEAAAQSAERKLHKAVRGKCPLCGNIVT